MAPDLDAADAGPQPVRRQLASPGIAKHSDIPPPLVPPVPPHVGLPDALYAERAAIIVALKTEGYTSKEICDITQLSLEQVKYALIKARREGKLQDVVADLSHRALPRAVENLMEALENPDNPFHFKATEATLEGLGAFKSHKNNVNEGSGGPAPLQIAFVMQGGGDVPTVVINSSRGEIGGTPRQDAE